MTPSLPTKKQEALEQELTLSSQIEAILLEHQNGELDTRNLKSQISQILESVPSLKHKKTALRLIEDSDPELYRYLPENLKQDPDIILATVQADGDMLQYIPKSSQRDMLYIKESMLSLSKKPAGFPKILDLLDSSRKEKERFEELSEYVQKELLGRFSKLQSAILQLFLAEYETFLLLQKLGFFTRTQEGLIPAKNLLKQLDSKKRQELESLPAYQRPLFLQEFLANFVGVSLKESSKLLGNLFEIFSEMIVFPQEAKKQAPDTDNEPILTSKTPQKPQTLAQIGVKESLILPQNYTHIAFGSYYYVSNPQGETHVLAKQELTKMSENSLTQYFYFLALLERLDLDFLVSKHARKVMLASDVDFYEGAGMSDARILKFLNSVAKNIGIPEKSFQKQDSETKLIGCFETLDGAKLAFERVKETGYAGTTHICNPSEKGDYSIVELALKQNGCIVPPYNEISLVAWK